MKFKKNKIEPIKPWPSPPKLTDPFIDCIKELNETIVFSDIHIDKIIDYLIERDKEFLNRPQIKFDAEDFLK